MDCNLQTFLKDLLGKYGFTMSDWIYLQQAYEREKMIQDQCDKRDSIIDRYNQPERLNPETSKEDAIV